MDRAMSQENTEVVREAIITCPVCCARTREVMPDNACQRRYLCVTCGTMVAPKPGDCCVFCSYSDTACPPRQAESGAAEQTRLPRRDYPDLRVGERETDAGAEGQPPFAIHPGSLARTRGVG